MFQEIYIIEDNEILTDKLKRIFKNEKEYVFINVNSNNLAEGMQTIPDLIIIDEDNISANIIEICNYIRKNNENAITPIMVISSTIDKEHRLDVLKTDVEYYIKNVKEKKDGRTIRKITKRTLYLFKNKQKVRKII